MNIKSIENFRDFGGVNGEFGEVRKNKLFRGAHLNEIDSVDIDIFSKQLNIRTVIDLRTPIEIERHPNLKLANVNEMNIDIMQGVTRVGNYADPLTYANIDPEAGLKHMEELYEIFIDDKTVIKQFSNFINEIAINSNDPVFFHCMAGKDRTGLGAAYLLKILGISNELIMQDYMLTNKLRGEANQKFIARLETRYGRTFSDNEKHSLSYVYGVKESYLKHVFDAIEQRYASWDDFFASELELSENTINTLRKNFLVNY